MDLRLSQAGRSNHIRRECLTFRRSTGGATTHIPTVAGRIAHTVVNMHPEPSRWPGLVAFTIGARGSADFRHGGVGGLFDQLRDVLIRVFAGKWSLVERVRSSYADRAGVGWGVASLLPQAAAVRRPIEGRQH